MGDGRRFRDAWGLPPGVFACVPLTPRVLLLLRPEGTVTGLYVNPEAFAEKLGGPKILLAFQACFGGCDRILAYLQALELSREKVGQERESGYRNLWVMLMSIAATMHEVGKALGYLRGVLRPVLEGRQHLWDQLEPIRKRWQDQPLPSMVRNQWAFHLGDVEMYQAGWAALLKDRPTAAPFFTAGNQDLLDISFVGARDMAIRGVGKAMQLEDFNALMKRNEVDCQEFPVHLQHLFMALVEGARIPIESIELGPDED